MEKIDLSTLRPDWFSLPPDQWPQWARDIYHIRREAQRRRFLATMKPVQSPPVDPETP